MAETKVTRICKYCSKSFEIYKYKVVKGFGIYCSKDCHDAGQRGRVRVQRTCKHCGISFEPLLARVKFGRGKFCSVSCSHNYRVGEPGSRLGKHHTDATKCKLSKIRREGYATGFYKHPMLDKHHTEMTKKNMSELKQGMYIGENNPAWHGGISFEPYCHKFNKQLKEHIRERDNRICQLCGEKENGRKLTVHHIHYDKPNCDPDLISLCCGCHGRTQHNRDFYEDYFMQKLTERGLLLS